MEAAAHTKGGYGGVPRGVGREFAAADMAQAHGKFNKAHVSHEQLASHAERVNAAHGHKGPPAPGSKGD